MVLKEDSDILISYEGRQLGLEQGVGLLSGQGGWGFLLSQESIQNLGWALWKPSVC